MGNNSLYVNYLHLIAITEDNLTSCGSKSPRSKIKHEKDYIFEID